MSDQQVTLDMLHARMGEVIGKFDAFESRVERMAKTVEAHDQTLRGNGKSGLVGRVEAVEKTLKARAGKLSAKEFCAIVGALGAFSATIGAGMAMILK